MRAQRRQETLRDSCYRLTALAGLVFLVCGCAIFFATAPAMASVGRALSERMLIKRSTLEIEAGDVKVAVAGAVRIVTDAGGHVENSSARGDQSASMKLRVPSAKLDAVLAQLAALGREKNRRESAEDVTGTVVDLDAKLKNSIALRDRLRKLLDQAKDVKDVLAIERELTRVQSEVDSMEGRLKALRGLVSLASVDFRVERTRILGPLGYLGKGLGWLITKLFVSE